MIWSSSSGSVCLVTVCNQLSRMNAKPVAVVKQTAETSLPATSLVTRGAEGLRRPVWSAALHIHFNDANTLASAHKLNNRSRFGKTAAFLVPTPECCHIVWTWCSPHTHNLLFLTKKTPNKVVKCDILKIGLLPRTFVSLMMNEGRRKYLALRFVFHFSFFKSTFWASGRLQDLAGKKRHYFLKNVFEAINLDLKLNIIPQVVTFLLHGCLWCIQMIVSAAPWKHIRSQWRMECN